MDLQEEARAAELQLAEMELEGRFRHNLTLLEAVMPEAYERFKAHQPEKLRLLLSGSGVVTLVNGHLGNSPVYPADPQGYAQAQVAIFRRAPKFCGSNSLVSTVLDEASNAHVSNANKLIRLLQRQPAEEVRGLPAEVDFMLMLGVGLGYQIQALLEENDIRNLCIIEPEADVFHASLHTLDWQEVFEHFSRPGHSLELIVGEDAGTCEQQLEQYLAWIGGYHVFRPFVYEHLVSEELAASYGGFLNRLMPRLTTQVGYFDDERVGVAHTVANHAAGVPVLTDHAPPDDRHLDVPAFIVANGPSLDEALEFIGEHRGRAVVFSCGTALGSLTKAGIKPDFHVEMERSRPVVEWIQSATDAADRDGVVLLALNTVHPEVMELFGRRGMALKPNDLGTDFLASHIAPDAAVVNLAWCNPTVANAGLSFACALGFREIHLFGLDLGFPAGAQHHSRLSVHYDVKDTERHTLGLYKPDPARNVMEPGNFGGEIVSTPIYRGARIAAEQVILATPGVRCHNTGHGVLIRGAQSVRIRDHAVKNPPFDTQAVAGALFDRRFSAEVIAPMRPGEAHTALSATRRALTDLGLIASVPVASRGEGMMLLAALHEHVRSLAEDRETRFVAALLKGSVTMFSQFLAQALHRSHDEGVSVALFRDAIAHFRAFLEHAHSMAGSDLLALDTRTRNLQQKMVRVG